MLGDRETGKRDAQARARRFGHLPIDERNLRFAERLHVHLRHVELAGLFEVLVEGVAELNNFRLDELAQQIVAFARALADAREDREAGVLLRDVIDQLLNQDGLADARAAEQTDLAAAQERLNQVNDLDAGLEHLQVGGLLFEFRRVAMDRITLFGGDSAEVVNRLADDVQDAPQSDLADGHRDRPARVNRLHAAHHAFGRLHRDGADAPLAQVLFDFADDVNRRRHIEAFRDDAQRRVNLRQILLAKFHVNDGADDLHDLACGPAVAAYVSVARHNLSVNSSGRYACEKFSRYLRM